MAPSYLRDECRSSLRAAFKRMDARLRLAPFLIEEFSIADTSLFFLVCHFPKLYGIRIGGYVRLHAWMMRLGRRAAVKRILGIEFY